MGSSFPTGGFGAGNPGEGMWQMLDQLRSAFEKRPSGRGGREGVHHDVRAAVLALLSEQPMHGYQIISEIEERSGGRWKPSAGSVYPTLQLLADEGVISAEVSEGRTRYVLTESGRAEASAAAAAAPWAPAGAGDDSGVKALAKAGFELAQAAAQLGRTGSEQQVQQAVTALDEARRRLYAILSQD